MSIDVLAGGGDDTDRRDDEQPRRAAPWTLVGAVGVLVLALVGGVTWAVGSLSGGGSQPEDALPSGAVAFAKVDLDPSLGQKLDGFRFLRQFPTLRDRIPADGDVREILFEAIADDAGWAEIDFAEDVDPWLGDRLAIAGYPAEGGPGASPAVVALQVTDGDAAREGLRALADASSDGDGGADDVGFVIRGDYALITESQATAERYAARADAGTLAEDERFSADVDDLAGGVATFWLDNAAAAEEAGGGLLGLGGIGRSGDQLTGRSTMVARFAGPDVFEIEGHVAGASAAGWATHPVEDLGDLPATSVLAAGVADPKALVRRVLDGMAGAPDQGAGRPDDLVRSWGEELGITVPEDLETLLGDNIVGAVDAGSGDRSGELSGGVRVRTDDVGRAESLVRRLMSTSGEQVAIRAEGDHYVVGTTAAAAERLLQDGSLAEQPGFAEALPDLAGADAALWVQPAGLFKAFFAGWSTDGQVEVPADLAVLQGVGATFDSGDDGAGSFRFRIVTG